MINSTLKTVAILGATVALTACSILPEPAPASVIYRLSQDTTSVMPLRNAEIIRVDRPAANSVFNTTSIIVSPDGRRLSTAAQARWTEPMPILLQESLLDQLGRSERLVGVLPTSGARTQTRVHLTMKNFEAQFDNGEMGAPLAKVRYVVTYAKADDRELLGTFTIAKSQRAGSNSIPNIVEALELANDAAMGEIVAWLEGQAALRASS